MSLLLRFQLSWNLKSGFRKTWSIASCGQPELITAEGPLEMIIKTCIKAYQVKGDFILNPMVKIPAKKNHNMGNGNVWKFKIRRFGLKGN